MAKTGYTGRHWESQSYRAKHRNHALYAQLPRVSATTYKRFLICCAIVGVVGGVASASSSVNATTTTWVAPTTQTRHLTTAIATQSPLVPTDMESPTPSTLPLRQSIAAYALDHVGAHYGAEQQGPIAFDELGLVLAAYTSVGSSIPATIDRIIDTGIVISADFALADVVFLTHSLVGVYVGNGKLVMANTVKGVVLANVQSTYAVRRFIQ